MLLIRPQNSQKVYFTYAVGVMERFYTDNLSFLRIISAERFAVWRFVLVDLI